MFFVWFRNVESEVCRLKAGTKFGITALTLAVCTATLWFYFVRQVNLPDDRTAFVVAFVLAAALGLTAYIKGTSWVGALPPAVAILISAFLTFTISISSQSVDAKRVIAVGDVIPHFSAVDDEGQLFDSQALQGHLVLIKFFRAHW